MNPIVKIILLIIILSLVGYFVTIPLRRGGVERQGGYWHYHESTGVDHWHRPIGKNLSPEEYNELFDPDEDGVDEFLPGAIILIKNKLIDYVK